MGTDHAKQGQGQIAGSIVQYCSVSTRSMPCQGRFQSVSTPNFSRVNGVGLVGVRASETGGSSAGQPGRRGCRGKCQ